MSHANIFTHANVVKEVGEEIAYEKTHTDELINDPFWRLAEYEYVEHPKKFLEEHKCEQLDFIVKHWHIENPTSHDTTHVRPSPPNEICVSSVPEPTSIVLICTAIIVGFLILFFKEGK